MKFSLFLLPAFLAIHGLHAAARPPQLLVDKGAPRAEIVIAENPQRMQKLAATELQKTIKKISGAELPIVTAPSGDFPVKIYVGKSRFTDALGMDNADLEHGAFRIKSGKDFLVLLGRDTDFPMEKPGGGEYPANRGDRERAAQEWTKQHGDQWGSPFLSSFKAFNDKLGLWSSDEHGSLNAVNDFLGSLGARWYMPGDFGEVLPQTRTIALPSEDKTVRPEFATRHMGFYGNAPFEASEEEFLWQLRLGLNPKGGLDGHGIAPMLEPENIKKEHPEFFALYGDRRETESRGGKPCLSSQGLLDSSVGFARTMADQYGKEKVSLMPTDGYSAFCQCELCKGKDTPERGADGLMSDYVWGFINRAAEEVGKTHPNLKITNYAYGAYRQPPEKIARFAPNVAVGICQHRSLFGNPATRKKFLDFREAYLQKLPSGKISIWEYYLDARSGLPTFYPHLIAEDIRSLKGKVEGEGIEVFRTTGSNKKPGPDPALAANHLNCWITARLWWNPDQDVDALLDEYYRGFYGPAAKEMKAFIEYCEANWLLMRTQAEPIESAFELLEKARKAAGTENIYAQRVGLIADSMAPLRELRDRLAVGRKNNPSATLLEPSLPAPDINGKLDDPFWKDLPSFPLKDLATGGEVANKSSFQVGWAGESLVFGVRCEDSDMAGLKAHANKDDDSLLFEGDSVEILLETPTHSYYQIAIDSAGKVADIDRSEFNSTWSAGAKVAAHRGDGFWSIEAAIPVLGSQQKDLDPDFGVSGDKPGADAPWYFNVCRVWKRDKTLETSAFSPTGEKRFHVPMKFGRLEKSPKTGKEKF